MIIYMGFIRCPGCNKLHALCGSRFGFTIECPQCGHRFSILEKKDS